VRVKPRPLARSANGQKVCSSSEQSAFVTIACWKAGSRIRFADERIPGVWRWNITIHLPGRLPMGSAKDLATAKAEFKAA
jgi:hypothetical protein